MEVWVFCNVLVKYLKAADLDYCTRSAAHHTTPRSASCVHASARVYVCARARLGGNSTKIIGKRLASRLC